MLQCRMPLENNIKKSFSNSWKNKVKYITPGAYGLVSGGAHSFGTRMNLSKSSNILTEKICERSNLYPWVFSLATSAS